MLAELGRVVTRWALIEAKLADVLAYLLAADPGRLYLLTQEVSGATLRGWLRTACHSFPISSAPRDEFIAYLQHLDVLAAERNALVHGVWLTDRTDSGVGIQTVRWARSEVVRWEIWSLGDIRDLAESIAEAVSDLGKLTEKLHDDQAEPT